MITKNKMLREIKWKTLAEARFLSHHKFVHFFLDIVRIQAQVHRLGLCEDALVLPAV